MGALLTYLQGIVSVLPGQCKKLHTPQGYITHIITSRALWQTNMQIYTDGRVRRSVLNSDISRMQWLTLILLSLFMGFRPFRGLDRLRDCGVPFSVNTRQDAS